MAASPIRKFGSGLGLLVLANAAVAFFAGCYIVLGGSDFWAAFLGIWIFVFGLIAVVFVIACAGFLLEWCLAPFVEQDGRGNEP